MALQRLFNGYPMIVLWILMYFQLCSYVLPISFNGFPIVAQWLSIGVPGMLAMFVL